jgi:hypothetical protein
MNDTPLMEIVRWFRDAHTNILQLADSLSEEQLRWQPHPLANSIGFQLWHLARGADYVQARLSDATSELSRRLGEHPQIWLAENFAEQWKLDPEILGVEQLGWEMKPEDAAQLQFPDKDALMNYLRRSFAAETQALDALDEEQFQSLRLHDWAKEQTVGNFLMSYFVHYREHLGAIQYINGIRNLLTDSA